MTTKTKTWNQLTKDERAKSKKALFDMMMNMTLKPSGDKVKVKKLSNQLAYMKRKLKADPDSFSSDKIGPEVLDTIKLISVQDSTYVTFSPIQSHNAEYMELMYLFTNTQPRTYDVITGSRSSVL